MSLKILSVSILALSLGACSKSSKSSNSAKDKPLKAIITTSVSGMSITTDASKSEGAICAYGTNAYPVDPNITFHWSITPASDQHCDYLTASGSGSGYIPCDLPFIPLVTTVDVKTKYVVALEILDKDKHTSWAYDTVTVK